MVIAKASLSAHIYCYFNQFQSHRSLSIGDYPPAELPQVWLHVADPTVLHCDLDLDCDFKL